MDASTLLRQNLNIPEACCRKLSESRFVCLVHRRWLKQLQRRQVLESVTAENYFTSDECQLHLAASYRDVPAPWTRVSVKVIQKSNRYVHSYSTMDGYACKDGEEPTFSEVMVTASQCAWQIAVDAAQRRYHSAITCDSTHHVAAPYKDFVSCTRAALKRVFNCDIIPVTSKQNELSDGKSVYETPVYGQSYTNLTSAYAVLESEHAFHVIQPYVQYSLYDTVTFSPTLVQHHHVTSLFILYQILRAIQHCHDLGVSVGDLRLCDIMIDSKLWVQLSAVHIGHMCVAMPQKPSSSHGDQGGTVGIHHKGTQTLTNEGPGCDSSHTASMKSCPVDRPMNVKSLPGGLQEIVQMWTYGKLSNFNYLMLLNQLAGRRSGDPNHHPILPWVMDFSRLDSGYRDLAKSKFRLNKGDHQLDLTYDNSLLYGTGDDAPHLHQDPLLIHHHITDFLSDITYYVYKARCTPKSVLCAHVRKRWVPNEYPMSMQRLYNWTPDECIPEFYTDPTIFTSLHHDLPDLELPSWAQSAEDFLAKHVALLESDYVSRQLHQWIDLTFGHKLSGTAAVQAKNVCLQLVDDHIEFLNHGVVQLFTHPHPPKLLPKDLPLSGLQPLSQADTPQKEHELRKDKRTHDKTKLAQNGRTGDAKKTVDEKDQRSIVLPDGYEPLKELDQLESMYEFCLDTTQQLPLPLEVESQVEDPWLRVLARDMQAFGCLMVELFMSSKTRVICHDASLDKRFRLVRGLCKSQVNELPRSLWSAADALLRLSEAWDPSQVDSHGPMFQYDKLMNDGLPPPTAAMLLHSEFGILSLPKSFEGVYMLLCSVNELGCQMQQVSDSDDADKTTQLKLLARRKVMLFSSYLSDTVLTRDMLELLMPYINEFFEDSSTAVQAALMLFDAVSRCMGWRESMSRMLHLTTRLFADDTTSPKHMKLYHRSFVLQLLVRFGLENFLANFSTLLVEACAGYKDFCGRDYIDRQMSEIFLSRTAGDTVMGRRFDAGSIGELGPTEELSDDIFIEEMSLDGDSVEATVALHYDGTSSDSGAVERDDGRSSTSAEQSGDGASNGSGEEIPSGSVGRATVPQFIDGHLHVDGDAPKRSPSTGSENDDDGAGDCEADIELARSMVRSETEEFASSVMDAGGNVEYNVKDVATETVKWLAHRLGPVLTAKYLSRNLLRMLALCYLGEEQLKPVKDMRNELSTTNVNVVGDEHATRVLDCLTCVAILYGEHIILLQYFQHIREQICVAVKKLTSKAEAGLVGCLQLLTHILPYLSDSTLMDILQETIFKDIILPILKIVSSAHISFPTRSQARSVICYKIIDALYVISLRIGFEMTRGHMTFVLQKFFAAFNRVHAHTDEETADLSSEGTMGSPNLSVTDKQALEESLYFEIKMDSQTKEYHIGTPIAVDSFLQHHRQNSGSSMKHSLSPPAHEDIEESPQFGEVNREQILGELRETFTPQLAHAAYIPFCRLAGDIHMEQNLINDDLIRRLCASHDQALSQQQFVHTELLTPDMPPYTNVDESCGSPNVPKDEQTGAASDDFVENYTVAGNKLIVCDSVAGVDQTSVSVQRIRCRSGEPPVDYNTLRSPEMDINKQRHLKGNWLAYWEHEVGLSDRQDMFDFKQIKLQTFTGHTSSVRAIQVLDNENSFMSASKDKTVKLWSLRSFGDGSERVGCQWTYSKHRKPVFSVSFIESMRLAVSNDSSVHVWDPFVGMCLRQYEASKSNPVTAMTPVANPSSCVITATADAVLRFLDVRMDRFTCEFKCTTTPAGLIRCIASSPDGNWLAVGYSSGVISVLDARTGLVAASWKGHEGEILQMKAFDNKSFLTSSFDQSMTQWHAEDGKAVSVFRGLTEPVHCISFYKGMMLTATTAKRVGVYPSLDSKVNFTSTKLRSDTFPGVLTTMAVLPANRLLLLGADNGAIRLLA